MWLPAFGEAGESEVSQMRTKSRLAQRGAFWAANQSIPNKNPPFDGDPPSKKWVLSLVSPFEVLPCILCRAINPW